MCDFCMAALMFLNYRSWNESKYPCPCGNCTFANLVHHQSLESTWPVASGFLHPDDTPQLEMCDFYLGMVLAIFNHEVNVTVDHL